MSPLRYPGGKRRLVRYIERFFTINELRPSVFVEPFAGGASVSLHVLRRGLAERVILADADPLIADFWKTVFHEHESEWLVQQVERTRVTLARWQQVKASRPTTRRERAFACLFLNRTSFSGILNERAGPIGGMQQTSDYPVDCRFPRDTLIRRIREIATYREQVTVWKRPWRQTLAELPKKQQPRGGARRRVCYYFDPPFFEKAEHLYRFCFSAREHKRLRDCVLALKDDWFLSYDVADGLHKLWSGVERRRAHIELLYQMPQRVATEAILSNLDLPGLQGGSPPRVLLTDATPTPADRPPDAASIPAARPAEPPRVIAWTPVRPARTH